MASFMNASRAGCRHGLNLPRVAPSNKLLSQAAVGQRRPGFTGTLPEFFEYLRTDPKFKPASREALSHNGHHRNVAWALAANTAMVQRTFTGSTDLADD
jgi:hypothetical protein